MASIESSPAGLIKTEAAGLVAVGGVFTLAQAFAEFDAGPINKLKPTSTKAPADAAAMRECLGNGAYLRQSMPEFANQKGTHL